ncbi:hypothetical protein PA10_00195 [Pseudomonas phage pPa_SNUABM_DT01]|nr:hypothetical protein PA10_00195 [Pseudomonas phage pPa_SNUABM_DT01]
MQRADLNNMIELAKLNPMAIQRAGIEYLERVTNGEVEITDASNAFVYLMEFASTLFANATRKDEFLNRLQYPEQAQTRDDLYRHMSTVDYINVFSSPSVANILLAFNKNEVIEKAVDTGNAGVKKLTIPRHTKILGGDVPFTLQYPIEIRVLPHGGLQIVYDNSKPSPTMPLETNSVEWSLLNYNLGHEEFIQMEVPCQQVEIKSVTAPLTASKVFNKTYGFSDQFYHCRVYASDGNGGWTEINTTHSDQVYNPLVPTAVLKLLDNNQLNVSIPQVYYTTGLVNRTLRIDIYTTRGVLELALNGYSSDMFKATFDDYDNDDNGKYTSPVARLTSAYFMASTPATGGSNAISFAKLKERVINNATGRIDVPITNVQIQSQLDLLTDAGFSCVTDVDNLTNRLYAASRELPAPDIKEVSTGVGANVITLSKTIDQILATADVKDNGLRMTILPSTLYKDEGGYLSIVDKETKEELLELSPDLLVDRVTNGNYFYTPFHYVYDITDNVFTVRPYYFGNPQLTRRFFVEDNGTMGVGINSNGHTFERTDTGWVLRIMSDSTDSLKELDDDGLVAQLAYIAPGEVTRTYLNGTLVGRDPKSKEWIFEFRFDSNWDVDPEHNVYLNGFQAEDIAPHAYPAAMSTVFDIFYGVKSALVEQGEYTSIDENMGKFLYTDEISGLYHEQVTLVLGASLEGLWARARSTVGEEQYLRYEETVYELWTTNVPETTATGGVLVEYDGQGKPHVVYKHKAGDIKYDEETELPIVLHEEGSIIYQDGEPIIASPRSVLRQVELCLFDGVYFFVTNETDLNYRETVPNQIVEWVNITLAPIRKKLLEKTKLWFHPKSTVGLVEALVDDSLAMSLQAAQHLVVEYYVNDSVYKNEVLKEEMRKATRKSITADFKEMQVTRDNLQTALKNVMGNDIQAVAIKNFGGPRNFSVITMADESSRLCIGKKLISLPNGTYGVVDSIDVVFMKHASE